MKYKLLVVAFLVAALICDASAEIKRRKVKKKKIVPVVQHSTEPSSASYESTDAPLSSMESIEQKEREAEEKFQIAQRAKLDDTAQQAIYGFGLVNELQNEISTDPCGQIHCSAGKVCELNKLGDPVCVCIKECPFENEERRRVCSNSNETFGSDCEVHRERCLCMDGHPECKGPQYNHVQVEYYGVCREMPACTADELADFPRRMRDWLYYIMRDMADRHELSEHYMILEKESENNLTRGWINAAVWKWCDLDAEDNDRFVSRHELFPIRAPLMSLEHCIAPFLNGCDQNDDHRVTLQEWGKCLELDESELSERCEVLNEH